MTLPLEFPWGLGGDEDAPTQSPLNEGSENDDAESIIRKHLNPALKGPNWDALIKGLSVGDDIVWENAQAAYNQLFLSTASGSYLTRLASDFGSIRPETVGLSDSDFRNLTIRTKNNKVTQESIREILEIYYGRDALRGYAETTVTEPFNLAANPTLTWTLDEQTPISLTFEDSAFRTPGAATALEVSLALTKAMADQGCEGFAVAVKDASTDANKVRIYSPSLGMRSSVRITGGNAQLALKFPSVVEVYSGTVTVGDGYAWVWGNYGETQTYVSLSATMPVKVDLSLVKPGDYVVVGADAGGATPGTYEVLDVRLYKMGANLTQAFYLSRVAYSGTVTQTSNDGYRFFRPLKQSPSGSQSVIVSQGAPGTAIVRMPATSRAVTRTPETGAYLRSATGVNVIGLQRLSTGVATVTTDGPHGLAAGDWINLDGITASTGIPYIYPGNGAAYGAPYIYPASHLSLPTTTQDRGFVIPEGGAAIQMTDAAGTILFAGGYTTAAGAFVAESVATHLYVPLASTTVTGDTEATGATRYSHEWQAPAVLPLARQALAASNYGSKALISGGLTYPDIFRAHTHSYDAPTDTWTTENALLQARAGHEQIELDNGKILAMGGAKNRGTALATTELFDGVQWWPGPAMNVPRCNFQAVKLSNGDVLAIGGRTLGQELHRETDLIPTAWRLNDTAGPIVGYGTSALNLTVGGVPTYDSALAKIDGCLGFVKPTSYLTGTAHAASRTALLGEHHFGCWFRRTGTGKGVLAVYGGPTAFVEAENVLLEIGFDNTDHLYFRYDTGAGISTTQATASPWYSMVASAKANDWNHVALTSEANPASPGTQLWNLYLNGAKVITYVGTTPTGGTISTWWIAQHPQDALNGFDGYIDDIVFRTIAKQSYVVQDYLAGAGIFTSGHESHTLGAATNAVERYNGSTWTLEPSMVMARGHHRAVVLPDDTVIVTGGLGYNPSKPGFPATTDDGNWPSTTLREIELRDPATGRWHVLKKTGIARYGHTVAMLSDNSLVMLGGSSTTSSGAELKRIEILNLDTMSIVTTYSPFANSHFPGVGIKLRGEDVVLLAGGNDGSDTHTLASAFLGAGHEVSGDGLNGEHRISAVTSDTLQFTTAGHPHYSSLTGVDQAPPLTSGSYWVVSVAERTSGVVTATLSLPAGVSHSVQVGDFVRVNTVTAPFNSGLLEVTAVTATTISYADPGADQASMAVSMSIAETLATDESLVTAMAAPDGNVNLQDHYLYGVDTFPLTAITGALQSALQKGHQYSEIVVSGTAWPSSGYVTINFGAADQAATIPYSNSHTNGGVTHLILDYSHRCENSYAVGATVYYGATATGYEGSDGFTVTAAAAGRVAAQQTVEAALAAGIDPDVKIVYPGDRGLGGEGLPTAGAQKLSDIVDIFGGDNLDEELENRREELLS